MSLRRRARRIRAAWLRPNKGRRAVALAVLRTDFLRRRARRIRAAWLRPNKGRRAAALAVLRTVSPHSALLEDCVIAARAAGAEILKLVARGFEVETKGDESPVTVCDRAAEMIILDALRNAAPGIPVIAEEEVAAGRIPEHGDTYFLVDPLDGTKEFVRGGHDYTVNIGLVVENEPVLGVVYQPAEDRLWGGLVGAGAFREDAGERRSIAVRPLGETRAAVASKSHFNQATADYLEQAVGACGYVSVGSSLKFCIVADGGADIYPRLSPTSEWDTAAGHAILLAAGGRVDDPAGEPLRYGKRAFLNVGFCATAGWQAPPVAPFLPDFTR